jgi:salicylate hydroxylase
VFFWTFFISLVWFWSSPVHLFFTFILPVAPLVIWIDGFISCLRTRTNEEIQSLLVKTDLDLSKWTFHSGQETVQWPLLSLNYYVGVKCDQQAPPFLDELLSGG